MLLFVVQWAVVPSVVCCKQRLYYSSRCFGSLRTSEKFVCALRQSEGSFPGEIIIFKHKFITISNNRISFPNCTFLSALQVKSIQCPRKIKNLNIWTCKRKFRWDHFAVQVYRSYALGTGNIMRYGWLINCKQCNTVSHKVGAHPSSPATGSCHRPSANSGHPAQAGHD